MTTIGREVVERAEMDVQELVKKLDEWMARMTAMIGDMREQISRIEKQMKDTNPAGFADVSRRS